MLPQLSNPHLICSADEMLFNSLFLITVVVLLDFPGKSHSTHNLISLHVEFNVNNPITLISVSFPFPSELKQLQANWTQFTRIYWFLEALMVL